MTTLRLLALALAASAPLFAGCSSKPPPPPVNTTTTPSGSPMGGDVLPPQARSAQPPAKPVNPMLQQ
jgi:hypothetical protein